MVMVGVGGGGGDRGGEGVVLQAKLPRLSGVPAQRQEQQRFPQAAEAPGPKDLRAASP